MSFIGQVFTYTKSSIDTTLSSDGVTPGGEKFRDTGSLETGFSKTESCSETGTSSAAESVIEYEKQVSSDDTYTTIASYSCSMRGYFPEDQDYNICYLVVKEAAYSDTHFDFLGLHWVCCNNPLRGC